MSFLLDSNTWISLLRRQDANVLAALDQHPTDEILLCSVVLAELWYGAERSGRREGNYRLIDTLQDKYQSLPFDDAAAREYAVIRATLAQQGNPIGPNDTMIAAIARSRGVTLVTNNVGEFGRVSGLAIEDWQSA